MIRLDRWGRFGYKEEKFTEKVYMLLEECRRLYLSIGEEVFHLEYPEWGVGRVVEEMNSTVPGGGLSMVRVEFGRAGIKTFINNIESLWCFYHAGIRKGC